MHPHLFVLSAAAERCLVARPGSEDDARTGSGAWGGCPIFPGASAGRVEPADGGAVAGAAERLELVVPRGAHKPVELGLEDRGAGGAEREGGAETALGNQDVAVGARHRGKGAEVG